jgi:hypothetical protein
MKRPNFTLKNLLTLVSDNIKTTTRAFSIVITITLIYSAAQAQNCNVILACNDGVQISLDDDCNMTIEPDMVLEGPAYTDDFYDVEAKLPNGTSIPQFTVGFDGSNRPIKRVAINRSHIGMALQVKVTLRGCANSCWGTAKIEDKLAPIISTCPCEERITDFNGNLGLADFTYDRPSVVVGCPGTPEVGVRYEIHNFALDVPGIVDFNTISPNVRLSLYIGTFDPLNTCVNLLATNQQNLSMSLLAGLNNYTLVVSSVTAVIPPTGFNYDVFVNNRSGNIKSAASSTICTRTCDQEAALLAQTATNATNRPVFTDGCSGALWVPTTTYGGTVNFFNSNLILEGGTDVLAPGGIVVGAQVCFTSPIAQNITFDWSTIITDSANDPVTYSVNATSTVLTAISTSGTNTVAIPLNGVFCLRVNTNNNGAYSTLSVSNIRLSGVSPVLTYAKVDSVTVLTCNDRYSKIVRRLWTATDPSGNISDVKTQYFYISRGSLAEVVCPVDWIRDCSVPFAKLPNGAPTPAVSGSPQFVGCSNMQVFYDDIVFDLCGAGIKVFRQWTIIDWCTGADRICNQTIKITDEIAPAFTCPVLPAISASFEQCLGNWQVTPPSSAADCSLITWNVFFSKDSTGLTAPPVTAVFTKSDVSTIITGILPAFAAQISSTLRPYTISGLPLGKTWIKYVITDECGNIRECITSINVVDTTPPTAICEDQTVVSIDDTGWGELFAESLDDHSVDNCGQIVKYEIRRKTTTCAGYASDLNFGPKVRFCCADVTTAISYVDVVLRVYDAAGNYNDCETTVRVQNKRPPTITCPAGRTLTCGDSRIAPWIAGNVAFDTLYFGLPTVGGVCNDYAYASRILSNNLNAKCGTGSVVREWYLVSNPAIKCSQTLTVTSPSFGPANVIFPNSLSLPTCDISKATPEVLNSKPIVDNIPCRDIGVSHTDQLFYDVPEACIKILRTWRVIDWCTYPTGQVIVENTQTIKLTGTGGAVFTDCTNKTFDSDPGACDKIVTLSATATDDCTDANDLKYSWSLDLGKNNTVDATGIGNSFTRTLPAGTHRVTFTVVNRCGTPSVCAYDVTVRSTKKPTPICLREVVWVLDADGSSEIWASDFNLKSENNCGDDSKLKFSFNAAGNQLARTFTCADVPNGQVARIPLKMYAIDENGNSDFCDVTLILQDSPLTNACTDNAGLLPDVAGRITTEMNEGLDQVEVALTNMVSTSEIKEKTKNQGEYKFNGVDIFDPKTITAYNNEDILNGVSTLDLVLIQRHILDIQKIASPYRLLAADINNSRSITASDLVNLRKLILGITNSFENNTSWRFVPTEYTFQDPAFPFDFPSKINLDSIFEDKSNVNFTAVKVGDVNNSALANITSTSTERRSNNALFTAEVKSFDAGANVKYEIKAGDVMEIMGAQFALEFRADQLTFAGVKGGAFDIKSHHFNAAQTENGKISFSFDIPKGITLKTDDVLFVIEFSAQTSGSTEAIRLDQSRLHAEVYETDATVRPLHLQLRDKNAEGAQNMLYQNEPNPFKDFTNISFELSKNSDVVIRVIDVTGKVVFTQKGQFGKGYNTVTVANNQLAKSGVYYYQIEAGEFSATKKMILIE